MNRNPLTNLSSIVPYIFESRIKQGGIPMPTWLKKQMQRAYFEKNRYQIKLLNECWFYYSKIHQSS